MDSSHSAWHEMVPHCGFGLHVSNNEWCWASFHVLPICRNVYLGLFPNFWLGCLFFWYWAAWAACIFWRLILCHLFQMLLFSPILRALFFTLLIVPFIVHKLLNLIRSHLFIFVFIFSTLGDESKKILLWFLSKGILPVFSSKSFVVISFTFRSFIHFIFVLESVLILLFYT